jgi:hypothetical protein
VVRFWFEEFKEIKDRILLESEEKKNAEKEKAAASDADAAASDADSHEEL